MKIKVTPHTIEFKQDTDINSGEYNVTKLEFELSEEYSGLSNNAIFTTCRGTCLIEPIVNNECIIPYEVLEEPGQVLLGVYGYETNGDELSLRYSPKPMYFHVDNGSFAEGQEPSPPTPGAWDRLVAQVEENTEDIGELQENKADKNELSNVAFSGDYNDLTNKPTIPTKTSDLDNDSGFIDKDVNDLTNYTLTSDLSTVATTGDYDDLLDKPNLSVYSIITETGSKIDLEINSSTYVLVAKLYDKNNTLISTSNEIDLPLESMVVGATYDSANKKIVLTLNNGQTIDVPVGDLVSGLQTEITPSNKLSSDLVDDTNHTNKFVTSAEKTTWNGKLDASKVVNATSTTAGETYDVRYINTMLGDIETLLTTLDVGAGV